MRLQFGDFLFVVGSKRRVAQVEELVGQQTEGLGSPTCPAGVCGNFTRGDFGQFADRLARNARAGAFGPGRRSSDRRAHLEPGWKGRATDLVTFPGSESGLKRNRPKYLYPDRPTARSGNHQSERRLVRCLRRERGG